MKAASSVGSEPCPDSYFLSVLPYSIPVETYISTSISETALYMKNINSIINIMTITQNRVHMLLYKMGYRFE